jgi:hypothetical protein
LEVKNDALLLDAMQGKKIPRAPSVPKIWLDLSANILGRDLLSIFNNPRLATSAIIEGAMKCEVDGARIFLYPERDVRKEGNNYIHYKNNRRLGQIDMMGGLGTVFDDPKDLD